MRATRLFPVLALALGIAACAPVTTYTDAEAPKRLTLDSATTQLELHFAPNGASLSPADTARLRQLAAAGRIDPTDRVTIAAAGPPQLAEARAGAVSAMLLNYGIVPVAVQAAVPPNQAVVEVTRTLVTLPPCPNWSKTSGVDYGNQPSSNFGCANEVNLGLMIARPTDLASGLPAAGTAAGQPSAAAVSRYLNDKVQLPTSNTALPIAAQGSNQQGSGTNSNSPTGTGTGSQ